MEQIFFILKNYTERPWASGAKCPPVEITETLLIGSKHRLILQT